MPPTWPSIKGLSAILTSIECNVVVGSGLSRRLCSVVVPASGEGDMNRVAVCALWRYRRAEMATWFKCL